MTQTWLPVGGLRLQLDRTSRLRSGAGFWRDGGMIVLLPAGLPSREETRLTGLLVWGLAGRSMSPAAGELARRLNEEHFRRPLAAVRFRHQDKRWGSCSAKGNINLSHRLLTAPAELVQAVLLHELAHLGCLNHGQDYWRELLAADPSARRRGAQLAAYGRAWADWWAGRLRALLREGQVRLEPPAGGWPGIIG
ncbi:MAG: M48 family metallopeptidase [Bacteroidota bacterium]